MFLQTDQVCARAERKAFLAGKEVVIELGSGLT